MLLQTFAHIPGISLRTERRLWDHGIRSWDDASGIPRRFGAVGPRLRERLDEYIPQSRDALRARDSAFFARLSSLGESWRAFPEFRDNCVYLDIETTGLSCVFDTVTVAGMYDGRNYRAFVGKDLQRLPAELKRYSLVITFNGAGFDLRFLRLMFPDATYPPIHIDLRWVGKKLGMVGGLKEIERQLGITRADGVADVGGFEATVLWSKYLAGDRAALDRLIEYNAEDVVHLQAIMEIFYDRLRNLQPPGGYPQLFKRIADLPAQSNARARSPERKRSSSVVGGLLKRVAARPRIVGIDLTGSERRATGWSLLDGDLATTRAIRADADLIDATIQARPDIVSIDSPLSLPEGCALTGIENASPIYRRCELALKRMGIPVFWCLLPSMKSLTMRGMQLASTFRALGLNVIESYPGAAQDILGIPRKGSSLSGLKMGLARAGIGGEWVDASVTHDEVDAITSALVGLFYMAGDHIALGNAAEDYLIVPRSQRINYVKLSTILDATGLDPVAAPFPAC